MTAPYRRILYGAGVIGGLLVTWALAKGWIDKDDAAMVTGILAALPALALAKTTDPLAVPDDASPTGAVAGQAAVVPAGEPVAVTPAALATSDTKADAAGHGRHMVTNMDSGDDSAGGCE